jgi:hypothetical protein
MHKNCDPATKISKDTIRFKFDSTAIVEGYDSANGEMNVIPIQADFFVFAKAICAYNDLAGGYISAHGTNSSEGLPDCHWKIVEQPYADLHVCSRMYILIAWTLSDMLS